MAKKKSKPHPRQQEYSKKYYQRHRAQRLKYQSDYRSRNSENLNIQEDKPVNVVSAVEPEEWKNTRQMTSAPGKDPRFEVKPIMRPEVVGDTFIDLLKPSQSVRWFNAVQSEIVRGKLVDSKLPE